LSVTVSFNRNQYQIENADYYVATAANGYIFTSTSAHILRNNYEYADTFGQAIHASATQDHNSWNLGTTITDADFQSLVESQLLNTRKADGSLPDITFLHLVGGSDMIDVGVNVGLSFNGSAPDLGCFES
jgi:hypothetical protein